MKITQAIIEEVNISELIKILVKIKQIKRGFFQGFSLLRKVYEENTKPDNKIFQAASDIFLIIIELKLQHPFVKDLINLNLNIEYIFEIHEIVKPYYSGNYMAKR